MAYSFRISVSNETYNYIKELAEHQGLTPHEMARRLLFYGIGDFQEGLAETNIEFKRV